MALKRSKSTHETRKPRAAAQGGVASMLQADWSRMAGAASLALSVLGIVGLIISVTYVSMQEGASGPAAWVYVVAIALSAAVAAVSVSLLMGREWAQRVLLAYWLLVAAWALVSALAALLWQAAGPWGVGSGMAATVVTVVAIPLAAGMDVLLVLASQDRSRLRYGSMATVTIVAAIAVAATVNLIAHKDPLHKDFEALGMYGVSEWSQKILAGVDQPLRLTCIYTSTDKKRLGSDYRPRVIELMDDIAARMRKLDKQVEAQNITSDSEKAEIIARLQDQLRQEASAQVKFLTAFQRQSAELGSLLEAGLADWGKLPKDSYLTLWELPSQYGAMLRDQARQLDELDRKTKKETAPGKTVDYRELVDEVKRALEDVQRALKDSAPVLKRRDDIAKEVQKNHASALEKLKKLHGSFQAMLSALGEKGKVADPKAALSAFAKAAVQVRTDAQDAATALQNVGGEKNAEYLADAACWQLRVGAQQITVDHFFAALAQQIGDLATNTEGVLQVLTPEAMAKQVDYLRGAIAQFQRLSDSAEKAAESALAALAKVDDATKALMAQAAGDKLFEPILKKLDSLLEEIKKMPEPKGESAGKELTGDNIIIVEVGKKFRVATFDEVWPLRERMRGMNPDEEEKRIFNGDSAVTSRILSMTQEPFATVYLTYLPPFDQAAMMQMMRMGMQMGASMPDAMYSPNMLEALSRRLREANFEVKQWRLDENLEAPRPASRPQVLIVLAPSPPTGDPMMRMMMQRFQPREFGAMEVGKIRAAVNGGVPAIFLSGWAQWGSQFGPPRFQEVNDYLREDWGIDVKSGFRAMAGIPDESRPGYCRVDVLSLSYLPLSSFTAQPIGKPLQGQRMLWTEVSPIELAKDAENRTKLPKGVTVEPLLVVPGDRRDIWCPKELDRLFAAIQNDQASLVRPQKGDIRPPFDLAVVAKRDGREAKNAGAIHLDLRDIKDWNALRTKLADSDTAAEASPGKAVWGLLDEEARKTLRGAKDGDALTEKQKADVAADLDRILADPSLYEIKPPPPPAAPGAPTPKGNWDQVSLPLEAQRLQARKEAPKEEPAKGLTEKEQRRLNRLALEAAWPEIIAGSQSLMPGKAVVLGMGASFFDFYMDRPVPKLSGKGGISFDPPPRADADVIVSSVYWLSGNREYIAAGPAVIKPVNISQDERTVLWALCVIGLPVLAAALGVIVMVVRRR